MTSVKKHTLCQWKQKRNIMHCINRNYIPRFLFGPISTYIYTIEPNYFLLALLSISNTSVISLADISICHAGDFIARRWCLQHSLCPYSLLLILSAICNLLYHQNTFLLVAFQIGAHCTARLLLYQERLVKPRSTAADAASCSLHVRKGKRGHCLRWGFSM